MKSLPLRVYIITTVVPELKRSHQDVVRAAIAGGADVVQFRDKLMPDEQFEAEASKLLELCRAARVPLIVNDRVEVAARIGADGVHVGQEDIVPDAAHIASIRRQWTSGKNPIIGVSARNHHEAAVVSNCGADYLGVGPIFPTPSKADASEPIGIEELARICRTVHVPVVAIGGITALNLRRIVATGIAGAAVISAVTRAPDMQKATEALHDIWTSYRGSFK